MASAALFVIFGSTEKSYSKLKMGRRAAMKEKATLNKTMKEQAINPTRTNNNAIAHWCRYRCHRVLTSQIEHDEESLISDFISGKLD
jgi:hypothetical protein